jgi:hypothetical protein
MHSRMWLWCSPYSGERWGGKEEGDRNLLSNGACLIVSQAQRELIMPAATTMTA